MIRDGNETDADCGGDTCRPCGASQHCKIDSDCITDICNPNTKQCDVFTEIDQCSNQELDEGEACEDAGGPLCGAILGHACYVGQTCQHDSNCEAGNVCDTSTKQCASCFDQERNGDETDVDCGGKSSRCEACADGKKCDRNGDCVSNMCVRGTCSSCFNGIQDGDEIDVDCSGSCEKPCPLLAKCKNHTDCVTKQCTNGTCVSRSREIECESTCGGPRCRFLGILCLEGETCEKDQDCLTGLRCIEEKCTNCNTPESKFDVRCGPLEDGMWCQSGKDCRSGMCKGAGPTRLCSSCWNGILDGSEMAIDSGGDCEKKYSLKAGVGETCWKNDDCATGFCNETMQSTEDYNITFEDKYCSAKTFERKCTNGIFDGPETDIKETCIDGGGPICRKIGMLCHSGESCEEDTDCYKGTCDKKKKTCTTCKDGIRNGAETDVDCGTGKCPKCTCCHLEFSIVSEDSHTGKITPKKFKTR